MGLVPVCNSVHVAVLADKVTDFFSSSVLLAGSNSVDEQGAKVRCFLCSLGFAPHYTRELSVDNVRSELQCCSLGECHKRVLFLFEHVLQGWLCLHQESIIIFPA